MPLRSIALFVFVFILTLTIGGCTSAAPLAATSTPVTATNTALPPTAEPATATAAPVAGSRAIVLTKQGVVQAIPPDSGVATMLTTLPTTTLQVELSPNGALIAFETEDQLLVRTVATGADVVVATVAQSLSDLVWSSDSSRLLYAFETGDDVTDVRPQLWLATLDGQPPQQIGAGFGPAWSPDGRQIAFVGAPFEGTPLFGGGPGGVAMLAAADGSNPRTVGSEAIHPGWQPLVWAADGTRIGAGSEVIDVVRGKVAFRAPVDNQTHISGIQAIAPDGRSVAFWRNLRLDDANSSAGFVERDALDLIDDQGQDHSLYLSAKHNCPCLPVGGQIIPVWTPAGDTILVPLPEGGAQLFGSDGTSQGTMPISESIGAEYGKPHWDVIGRTVLITMFGKTSHEVWMFTIDGQPPRLLGNGTALGWQP